MFVVVIEYRPCLDFIVCWFLMAIFYITAKFQASVLQKRIETLCEYSSAIPDLRGKNIGNHFLIFQQENNFQAHNI